MSGPGFDSCYLQNFFRWTKCFKKLVSVHSEPQWGLHWLLVALLVQNDHLLCFSLHKNSSYQRKADIFHLGSVLPSNGEAKSKEWRAKKMLLRCQGLNYWPLVKWPKREQFKLILLEFHRACLDWLTGYAQVSADDRAIPEIEFAAVGHRYGWDAERAGQRLDGVRGVPGLSRVQNDFRRSLGVDHLVQSGTNWNKGLGFEPRTAIQCFMSPLEQLALLRLEDIGGPGSLVL